MEQVPAGLIEMIERPFSGRDIVEALGDPNLLEDLHLVLDPIAAKGFVTEMVGDENFRRERTGIEGFMQAWQDWAEPFERLRIELDEMEMHGDKLLTLVDQVSVPKGTETEIRTPGAAVWTLADGKLTRVEFHLHVEAAKRSAGLDA